MNGHGTPGTLRRAFIVYHAAHVAAVFTAATELRVPVTLRSAPAAAAWLGPAGFRAMILDTAAGFPGAPYDWVLDCGDSPGLAMNALRHDIPAIVLRAPPAVMAKIADMAATAGARLEDGAAPALDLLDAADPLAACRDWLASPAESIATGRRGD